MTVDQQFNLKEAMSSGRLALHYQPRIHGPSGRIIGVEGLLRWCPDGREWVGVRTLADLTANEFALLWEWELGQAAELFDELRAAGWRVAGGGQDFFISFNLCYKQLADDRWARQVLDLIDQTGLPGRCIEIELTEQGTVQDAALTASAFELLRTAGVVIALDDFPEGGSSMLRLAQFRFDKVKIDRCMVPQLSDSVAVWMKKRQILGDLIAMVERNGAVPVIEGVERDVQFKFLSQLNVREWQGFLWGGAMPMPQVLRMAGAALMQSAVGMA